MTQFLPCPFCGGPAGEVGLEFVTCLSAEVGAEQICPGKQIRLDVEDAERWNVRSAGDRYQTVPMTTEQFDTIRAAMQADDLRNNWDSFSEGSQFDGSADFAERMEAAGLVELRPITQADIDHFSAARGHEVGTLWYGLTSAGRAALTGAPRNDRESPPFMMQSCVEAKQCLHQIPGCICDHDPAQPDAGVQS